MRKCLLRTSCRLSSHSSSNACVQLAVLAGHLQGKTEAHTEESPNFRERCAGTAAAFARRRPGCTGLPA